MSLCCVRRDEVEYIKDQIYLQLIFYHIMKQTCKKVDVFESKRVRKLTFQKINLPESKRVRKQTCPCIQVNSYNSG